MPKTMRTYGSRRLVFSGGAEKTTGGLRKADLVKNRYGRIVSAKKHHTMRRKHGGEMDSPKVIEE